MDKKIILFVFLFGVQFMFGQNAITSLKINIINVQLSSDAQTISYDVYLQNINEDTTVSVPDFLMRLAIPQSDIGLNAKKLYLTNATKELGVSADTITSYGCDWILKFMNGNFIASYETALVVNRDYPGTRIGTVNVTNADGSAFSDELTLNLNHSGMSLKTQSTCSVFKPKSTFLALNSTTSLPPSNFTGLGTYTLYRSGGFTISPNPATNLITVYPTTNKTILNIFDLSGKKKLSKVIEGNTEINISSLAAGVYVLEINGIQKKIVKE